MDNQSEATEQQGGQVGFARSVVEQPFGNAGTEKTYSQRDPGQQAAVVHGFGQGLEQHDAADAEKDEAVEHGAEFALAVQPGIGQGAEQQREQAGGENGRVHGSILRRAGVKSPTRSRVGCRATGRFASGQSGFRQTPVRHRCREMPTTRGSARLTAPDLSLIHISEPTRPY